MLRKVQKSNPTHNFFNYPVLNKDAKKMFAKEKTNQQVVLRKLDFYM